MGFLSDLVLRKRSESVILIDIGADSIGGAYAVFADGSLPVVLYTMRLSTERHAGEHEDTAMLRTLKQVTDTITKEGAPVLARATGSGRANRILVSIDAPWQKVSVRTEHFDPGESFIFNDKLVDALLKETGNEFPGKQLVDESVIGTMLNGYETKDPYGKSAHRAAIVVMTSFIDEAIAQNITTILRGAFHMRRIIPIAGSSIRYQALHKAFPHERDALMIDAIGPLTSVALVRSGLFAEIIEVAVDTGTYAEWGAQVEGKLGELAKRFPLPRTLFLLTQETKLESLRKKLDDAKLGDLWLSDNPPNVISVLVSHLNTLIRQTTTNPPDITLLLMALFCKES